MKIITLDVRADIREGREPFSRIMGAAAALQPDEELLLIAPFEPIPLFHVLERRGFLHEARPVASGDWEILLKRRSSTQAASTGAKESKKEPVAKGTSIVEVDARGLEPPEPLVRILEALAALPPGADLRARTDRRPMHLYPHLAERGFTGETEEQSDGSFLTHIRAL